MQRSSSFTLVLAVLLGFASPAIPGDPSPLEAQVRNLIRELSDDEFAVRHAAYEKLEALGSDAEPFLVEALDSEDPEVSRLAGRLLRSLGQRDQSDLLGALSTRDNAFRASEEFQELVGRGREILPALLAAIAEEETRNTSYSYYRMRNAYWVLAELVTEEDMEMLFGQLEGTNVQHRILLQPILQSFDREKVLRKTIAILTNPKAHPQARAHLVELSINTSFSGNDVRIDEAALAMLEDPSDLVRTSALRYLGIRRRPAALEAIIKCAGDDEAVVRAAALQALRNFRDPAALPTLRAALLDPDPTVRSASIEALRSAGGPDMVPAVKPFLTDPDPMVRSSAAQFLARFGDRSALPVLLESLKLRDDESLSRTLHSLLDAIGQIGDETALVPLFTLLDAAEDYDRIKSYRYRILQSILKIGGEAVLPKVEPFLLLPGLQNSHIVLDEIGRLESDRVIPLLLKALEEGDERLRTSAVRGLSARNHAAAAPLIAKALTEETDTWFLSEAVKALTNFGYEPAVPTIRTFLHGDVADMNRVSLHYATIRAMMRFHVAEEAPRIAEMARASPQYTYLGVDALASLGNPDTIDALIALYNEESNDSRRMRIAMALARMGHTELAQARLPTLGDGASSTRADLLIALGQLERARADLDTLIEASPENGTLYYDRACVKARTKDPDGAFADLDKAFETRRFSKDQLITDPDLASLREDPRFKALLSRAL
jgi:HEAT repeat protein